MGQIFYFVYLYPHTNETTIMHIAIIGAGAAGCFTAINLKRWNPTLDVTVFESGTRPLAKVALTGGGRCNLTNSFEGVRSIASVYPRGEKLMKRLLQEFSHRDVYRWFEQEGVRLMTQDDQCVFPQSQNAMEIVGTLVRLMNEHGVVVKTQHRVRHIEKHSATDGEKDGNDGFHIHFKDNKLRSVHADRVVVTTGGQPKAEGLDVLKDFALEIMSPVPSLFSVCLPSHPITEHTGTVVQDVDVCLTGTKHRASGALLITHWGMSGPAILRLSAYAARTLHEQGYKAQMAVNWFGGRNETEVRNHLNEIAELNPQKQISTARPQHINARLWTHLLRECGIKPEQRWGDMTAKGYNKLVSTLTNNIYQIDGKNRFKEEFVTCGGVSLSNVNPRTLECKSCPGLYFAGEILDVDAVTGGFNLQAAWTMGWVVARGIGEKS
jgi:predicted Rossmann fold flavoprotein